MSLLPGQGVRPSLEYTALTAYRKIETQAVKGLVLRNQDEPPL